MTISVESEEFCGWKMCYIFSELKASSLLCSRVVKLNGKGDFSLSLRLLFTILPNRTFSHSCSKKHEWQLKIYCCKCSMFLVNKIYSMLKYSNMFFIHVHVGVHVHRYVKEEQLNCLTFFLPVINESVALFSVCWLAYGQQRKWLICLNKIFVS